VRKASQTSAQDGAFQRLVEIISAIPECARSKVFGLSLTDEEHPDFTTGHLLRPLRKELQMFMPVDDLPHLVTEVCELDDTRNNVEVAFAIDRILRRSRTDSADSWPVMTNQPTILENPRSSGLDSEVVSPTDNGSEQSQRKPSSTTEKRPITSSPNQSGICKFKVPLRS